MTATDVPRLSARVTPGNAGQRREHDSQYPAALLLGGRALAGLPPEHDAEERQVRHHFGVVGWSHLPSVAGAIERATKCTERTVIHDIHELLQFVRSRPDRAADRLPLGKATFSPIMSISASRSPPSEPVSGSWSKRSSSGSMTAKSSAPLDGHRRYIVVRLTLAALAIPSMVSPAVMGGAWPGSPGGSRQDRDHVRPSQVSG
jgi:hypothetical protein